MRLLHEIAIFQTVKSKVIISLFETVRLSVSISLRNLYNSLNSIKEKKRRETKITANGPAKLRTSHLLTFLLLQSNFNGSNTIGTMKISSKQG